MNFTEFVQRECPSLVPLRLPHWITLAEVEAEFGHDPDWPKYKNDPRWLHHLAKTIHFRQLRQAGKVPQTYTAQRDCEGCGPVFLEPWTPAKVAGCPWCYNRGAGFPIPSAGDARTTGGAPMSSKEREADLLS